MEKIKIGVIGCGLWGSNHIEAYRGLPHAEVVAVADTSSQRAEEVAKTFNIPRWFDNHEELCALKDLDAVSVVTPEAEHLKPVVTAAREGKHILVEKPVACTVSEVEAMIEAARKANVILMPGHILRFETRYAMIKEKLTNHELGAVVSIRARRNRTKQTRKDYARAHPVFAAAVHDIDLLLWYADSEARRVRGFQRNIAGHEMPDVMWGIVEFASGALGSIESTWLTPDPVGIFSDDVLQLITDKGIANIDLVNAGLNFWMESGLFVPDLIGAPRIRGVLEGALAAELSYFASCVMRGEKPQVITAEEAKEGIRVAVALVESAEKAQDVILRPTRVAC